MSDFSPGEDPHRSLNPEQQSHVIAVFALRRRRETIGTLASAVAVVFCLAAFLWLYSLEGLNDWRIYAGLMGLSILSIFANGIFQLINLRCPQCNASQARTPKARFCHNCGVRLKRDR